MRTTLDISDDVLQAAKERARLERKTTGQVVSELLRRALTESSRASVRERAVCGFSPFPSRGGLVTNEMVDELRHDDAY